MRALATGVNIDTGEAMRFAFAVEGMGGRRGRKGRRGNWVKLYQDGIKELMERRVLRGESSRVMFLLMAEADWENQVPSPIELARRYGMERTAAYRGYRELMEAELVIKREGHYYVSPLVMWKGTEKQLETACARLMVSATKGKCLPPPTPGSGGGGEDREG